MSDTQESSTDAMTADELSGTAAAPPPPQKDAFSELMAPKKPKPKPQSPSKSPRSSKKTTANGTAVAAAARPNHILTTEEQRQLNYTHGRDALVVYTQAPECFPATRVLSYDADFVVIHDLYPKASLHLLLLPRDAARQRMHPFAALDGSDARFLAAVQAATARLRALAAAELRRRHGRLSALDAPRNAALNDADADAAELPPGRDWSASVISGVHAAPSMNHLHVHVLSVDRVSECSRDRRHYNSFSTPFLVPVEDFPLADDDPRRHPGREGYLDAELKCWRCGRAFGHSFASLKRHLADEFEEWKRV